MSYVKIWVHAVWATRHRKPVLLPPFRQQLFNHIYEVARSNNIIVAALNGYSEHVHCLFRLGNEQPVSKVIQLMKGESSHWANRQQLFEETLKWQHEYFAVSVSESQVERVRNYIFNQEQYHAKKSFESEEQQFVKKYGITLLKSKHD